MRYLTVVALIALAGCYSVNAAMLGTPRMPLEPHQVAVYFLDDVGESMVFERIAILNATGGERNTEAKMLWMMREKAAELGANAIILEELRDPTTEEQALNVARRAFVGGMGAARQRGRALAIYVPPR